MGKGWTAEKRRLAAQYGRMGNRAGKAAGGRLGGKMAWEMLTPEERVNVVERLRAARQPQGNESSRARAAQRARARAAVEADMSQAKAEQLADMGILKRAPIAVAPVAIATPTVYAAPPATVAVGTAAEAQVVGRDGLTLEESGRRARLMATKPEWSDYPSLTAYQEALAAWRRELLGR